MKALQAPGADGVLDGKGERFAESSESSGASGCR